MTDRNVLLISNYNAVPRAWNGVPFEFLDVISKLETARIVAPGPRISDISTGSSIGSVLRFAVREVDVRARRLSGRLVRGEMCEAMLDTDYDLCFAMFQFARNLPNVDQVRDWRARSRLAVAFVLESWSSQFEKHRAALRLLDQFDHVFVFNAGSIPALRRYTSTPISFLPSAADTLAGHPGPERVIDFLSLGRRLPKLHGELRDVAAEQGLFYVYDPWTGLIARDWAEARAANADMIRRSRYYIAWDPTAVSADKGTLSSGENVMSTRYFEGAAGGAILLGSRPDCREFDELFDWPDAVVEIAPDGSDLRDVLAALDADPDRVRAVRRANAVNCLRRHDWAHRWARILDTLDLPRTAVLEARLRRLDHIAGQIEVEHGDTGAYKMSAE